MRIKLRESQYSRLLKENDKDFLKPAMDELKTSVSNLVLKEATTPLLETLQNYTDFNLSNPNQIKEFYTRNSSEPGSQFKVLLSEASGINLENISDPKNFASILSTRGGKGFSGIISIYCQKNHPHLVWTFLNLTYQIFQFLKECQ